jgi:serine/threonine-protein kinase
MQLGKYDIHEVIGKGGFGTVYRATDRALGVERAVKIMHPALSQDAEFLERFRLEAHIAARLDHPYIVPVHDLDEINGAVFLVMKYMPGGSLKQRLANHGPLPFPLALKLLAQMALALDHAHQQGLIHRDVKPANVLFETDDLVRLTDFGFAKVMTTRNISSSLTLTGGLIGTPPYMPPEIWRHKSVSPAVDQYSLACLFFECLTGQTLFAGESPAEIMTRHVLDGPIFPSDWPAEIPAGMTAILEKALANDPTARFASCRHFAKAVAELSSHTILPASQSILVSQPVVPVSTTQPAVQSPSSPTAMPAFGPMGAPQPELRPVAIPHSTSVPAWSAQPGANYSRPTESTHKEQPWWIVALIILAGLGLLFICGIGAVSMLDRLSWDESTSVVEANPTNTARPQLTVIPTIKPATSLTTISTPIITSDCNKIGQTLTSPIDGMTLVCVPASNFLMGSTDVDGDADYDEKPQHAVYLDAYWVDQTEVTNAMFAKFVKETGYRTTAEKEGTGYAYTGNEWGLVNGADWLHPSGPDSDLTGKDQHPVVQVSWEDAVAYCHWAGRQLPTEAQWEKAARGTDGRLFPWGNQSPSANLLNFDWHMGDTTRVGQYSSGASPYGVLDMAGNVWEWTADWYGDDYYSSQTTWRNPTGLTGGNDRVVRGGSWNYDARVVRSASRNWYSPDKRDTDQGFRCILITAP